MAKIKMLMITALLLGLAIPAMAGDDFGGPEITFDQPASGVAFSHASHVGDMGFECDSCHDKLFEMESGAAAAAGDFTMASLAKGKYCGACHNGTDAFASTSDCTACHAVGGDILYDQPVRSVTFSHQVHADENGLGCSDCHDGQFAMKAKSAQGNDNFAMEALYSGEYCGACHDGATAFASNTRCASCHGGVKEFKRVSGGETAAAAH